MVFINPFAEKVKKGLASLWQRKYIKKDVRRIICTVFRAEEQPNPKVPVEPQLIQEVRSKLDEFLQGVTEEEEIPREKLGQFLLGLVLDVMQKNVGLEIKAFFSRDKDEIYVKMKASENNL